MSLSHRQELSWLLAVLLAAPAAGVHADDQSQPASPDTTSSAAAPNDSPAPAAHPASTKSTAVCFKLTLHCVGGGAAKASTSTASPSAAANPPAPASPASAKSLNLSAPDVRSVVSADELQEPLPTQEQEAQVQDTETVQVKGSGDAPDVPGGFASLWWAVKHPTQAWRIVAPVE